MKRVAIVGMGVGADSLTAAAVRALDEADVLFGSPRLLNLYNKEKYPDFAPDTVAKRIAEHKANHFAVLVSGDPGFYSAADKLCDALTEYELTVIPSVSSLNAFFAKLRRPWQDAAATSCHARDTNLVDTVRRNRLTFVLTGGETEILAQKLTEFGFGGLTVYTGENIGLDDERVAQTTVRAMGSLSSLAVLLIKNPNADARVRFGLSDQEFLRGDAPMTKAEIRAVVMSKLALPPHSICADIGAGTGSVSVEMALAAYEGKVFAVEREPAAAELIRQNCRKFQVGNVVVHEGEAPAVLEALPPLTAAFIGGTGGHLADILKAIWRKNKNARIVLTAITIQTVNAALALWKESGAEPELILQSISRLKSGMLIANNPIFIVSGGGT